MSESKVPGEVYSEIVARLRSDRVADLTLSLVASEGQPLRSVLLKWSKRTGRSMKTVNEYWDVISEDNKGPIYEKNGVITIRNRRRLKGLIPK